MIFSYFQNGPWHHFLGQLSRNRRREMRTKQETRGLADERSRPPGRAAGSANGLGDGRAQILLFRINYRETVLGFARGF